jgi:hypothetical protein
MGDFESGVFKHPIVTCGSGPLLCMGGYSFPPGWLQVTCVSHCSIYQSKIFLAHRQCSIRSENLINHGTALSKDLAVSG